MDPRRFDALARSLAAPNTRRGFLGVAAGAVAGLLGAGRAAAGQVTQATCGNVSCRANPGKCKAGCVCCVYGNGNSRCVPPGQCSGGNVVSPTTTAAPATTTPAPVTTTAAPITTTPVPVTTTSTTSTTSTTTTATPATTTTAAATTTTTTTTTTTAAATTAAATTSTTTTAAAVTTTTTTTTVPTPPPPQGICPGGATFCTGQPTLCGGTQSTPCFCAQTRSGATACLSSPSPLAACTTDASCGGQGRYCIDISGPNCPRFTDPETGQPVVGICGQACSSLATTTTTTTSTTLSPQQGTCPTGANFCSGQPTLCGGTQSAPCICAQSKAQETICAFLDPASTITACSANAGCGPGQYCIDLIGPSCTPITNPETGQQITGICLSTCA